MFSKGAIYVAAIYMDSLRGRRVTGGWTASLESCPGTPTRNIPAFSGPTLALPLDEDGPDARLFSSPRHSMAGVRIAGQLQVRISRHPPYGPRRCIRLVRRRQLLTDACQRYDVMLEAL